MKGKYLRLVCRWRGHKWQRFDPVDEAKRLTLLDVARLRRAGGVFTRCTRCRAEHWPSAALDVLIAAVFRNEAGLFKTLPFESIGTVESKTREKAHEEG